MTWKSPNVDHSLSLDKRGSDPRPQVIVGGYEAEGPGVTLSQEDHVRGQHRIHEFLLLPKEKIAWLEGTSWLGTRTGRQKHMRAG